MSRLRIIVLAVLAVIVLLVGGIWFVPGLLDWNRYRDGIATLASARIGRPVHIGGAVTLNLLPQPILTAAGVSVEDDGDGIQLQARALRLRVGLGALLAGTIDARELTLQGAELRLPWPPPAGALATRPPAWISGLHAQVEDGRLQVGAVTLDHVEGSLATDPETGTLSAAGVGQVGPDRWQFTARLTRPDRDGAAGLDVSLDGQGGLRDTGGTFSGQLGADGALSGRVTGRGPDLSRLMAAPAVPWRGDGRLSASGGLAVADELALEIAGAPARGAVALRVSPAARLDLALAAGRLDLDAWFAALAARPDPTPAAVPTGIDLSAEAASWAGGTLRRVRAAIDLGGDGILLRDVSAVLPGEAQVQLSGQVTRLPAAPAGPQASPSPAPAPPAKLQFTGPVRVTAPDLPATLRWLQPLWPGATVTLPPTVLRRTDLAARLVVSQGSAEATELHGTLDGAAITGTAAVRAGARPGVTASLAVDRLALDAWLPGLGLDGGARPTLAELDAMATRMRSVDTDLRLQVQNLAWRGIALGASMAEVQTEATRIILRRLETSPAGARLSVSGQLAEGLRVVDGRLDLSVPDLRPLRQIAADLVPGDGAGPFMPLLRGPGVAALQASGPPDTLATRLTLELSDLRIEAQPVLNLPARRAAGALTVHHPGAPRLMETLGLGGTASWLGDGSFSIVGQLAVTPGKLELTGTTLAAGAARATGRISLDGRKLTGQVSAETLPLPMVYLHSPDPLPLSWLRDWQAELRLEAAQILSGLVPVLSGVTADVSLEGGVLRLAHITGHAGGGAVSGSATLDATAAAPHLAVQGQALGCSVGTALAAAALDLVAGQVDTTLDLSASGHSPAALLSTLAGTAALRVRAGLIQGFDLAAAGAALVLPEAPDVMAAARAALLTGTTPIADSELKLAFDRGSLSLDGTLSSEAGTGTATGSIDLRDGAQDLRLGLTPVQPKAPTLGLRVTGPMQAPRRTPELAGLARWLAEHGPEDRADHGPTPKDQARAPSSTE